MRKTCEEILNLTEEVMNECMYYIPTVDAITGLNEKEFLMIQKMFKLYTLSRELVTKQLDMYDGINAKLDRLVEENQLILGTIKHEVQKLQKDGES